MSLVKGNRSNYLSNLQETLTSSLYEQPSLTYTSLYRLAELPIEKSTIRICKNYLDTFKQPLQEKQYIHKRQIFSKSVPLQRGKSTNDKKYKNYERMLTYSVNKKTLQEIEQIRKANHIKGRFQHRKITNLKQVVQKKMNQQLMAQNTFSNNDEVVEEILKDNKQRQQLFEESIFVDRLLQIKKQKLTKEDRKRNKIEYQPRHFHLNQHYRDINTFYRRKFAKERSLFKCQRQITSFQSMKLREKQEQNNILMQNLMKHYGKQVKTQTLQKSIIINQTIKRLFLHYSIKQGATHQSYTIMSNSKLNEFLKDFNLTINNEDQKLTLLRKQYIEMVDFIELVYSLANNLSQKVYQFLKQKIISKQQIYIPTQCLKYQQRKERIEKYYKTNKVYPKLQMIYESLSKRNLQYNGIKWLNFDHFHQFMLVLKIYPTFIQKSKLKYYYLYQQSINKLIKLQNLKEIIAYIALINQSQFNNVLHSLVRLIKKYQI